MSARSNHEEAALAAFTAAQPKLKALAARVQSAPDSVLGDAKTLLIRAQSKHDEALHLFELLKRAGAPEWWELRVALDRALCELRAALAGVP